AAAAHRSCRSFHSRAAHDAPIHQFLCSRIRHCAAGTSSPAVACWLRSGNRTHAKRPPRPPSIQARPRSQSPPARAKQSDSRMISLLILGTNRHRQSTNRSLRRSVANSESDVASQSAHFGLRRQSEATTALFHSGLILWSIERQLIRECPLSRARKAVWRRASHRTSKNAGLSPQAKLLVTDRW